MINLNDAVSLLQAKRRELIHQLEAVDKALAALKDAESDATPAVEQQAVTPVEAAAALPVPTRVKPARILTEAHKHALSESRRKASHSKDAAAGLAREAQEPPGASAAGSHAHERLPRLVKRTRH